MKHFTENKKENLPLFLWTFKFFPPLGCRVMVQLLFDYKQFCNLTKLIKVILTKLTYCVRFNVKTTKWIMMCDKKKFWQDKCAKQSVSSSFCEEHERVFCHLNLKRRRTRCLWALFYTASVFLYYYYHHYYYLNFILRHGVSYTKKNFFLPFKYNPKQAFTLTMINTQERYKKEEKRRKRMI